MTTRALVVASLLLFVGCTADAGDPRRGPGGGKLDDPTATETICGIELQGFEYRGIGEVGEVDLDPRLAANTAARDLNLQLELDCVAEIDRCYVPTYSMSEDETMTLVALENTELVGRRMLFVIGDDVELVAEQGFQGCTLCESDLCPEPPTR